VNDLDWISAVLDHIDQGTGRSRKIAEEPLLRGINEAWAHTEVVAARFLELRATEPASYRCAGWERVLGADLPDKRAFFAAVCLCSVGLWSQTLSRARPAAILIADGKGGPDLTRMLAQTVLGATQGEAKAGRRPPAGLLEEVRDLGVAVMRVEFDSAQALAVHLGANETAKAGAVHKAIKNWPPR